MALVNTSLVTSPSMSIIHGEVLEHDLGDSSCSDEQCSDDKWRDMNEMPVNPYNMNTNLHTSNRVHDEKYNVASRCSARTH